MTRRLGLLTLAGFVLLATGCSTDKVPTAPSTSATDPAIQDKNREHLMQFNQPGDTLIADQFKPSGVISTTRL